MNQGTVYIVDDDPGIRKSLSALLGAEGFLTQTFESAQAFLDSYTPDGPGCLIADIRMPGMSGLELQEKISGGGDVMPVIIISAHADVATAVRAMKNGSFDFLEKPYSAAALIQRIRQALEHDFKNRAALHERHSLRQLIGALTPREHEILQLVVSGKPSKAIATELNLSVSTVDNHRAKIMRKLHAETTADLARIALAADPALLQRPLRQ